ncbi:unnamed protein product [Pleuronectes platessa]|uniref:Uncharacterized protein n=1 Tax=Pleuronectes platessa TaxID=8262 RepID=A0A9N7TP46_PLEPL|nr:unnamed protein product [Pleuronectes platessa]
MHLLHEVNTAKTSMRERERERDTDRQRETGIGGRGGRTRPVDRQVKTLVMRSESSGRVCTGSSARPVPPDPAAFPKNHHPSFSSQPCCHLFFSPPVLFPPRRPRPPPPSSGDSDLLCLVTQSGLVWNAKRCGNL